MSLLVEELERYLNIIFTGQKFSYIEDKLFVFKHPDNIIRMRSDLIYDRAHDKALSQGMLPVKDLEVLIRERNIFTEEDENALERLNTQLEAQHILLSKTTRVKARQDRIKETIANLKKEARELEYKRISKLSMSAESKAEEERLLFLCFSCTYVEDGNRHWNTFNDLLNERKLEFKDKILYEYIKFRNGIDTSIIRQVARSSLWRIRYVTSQKATESLFGIPTSQYTNDMLNLAYWSNFYQSVYEMMPKDRPPDSIIDDDDSLDAYMKDFYEERNREDASEWSKNKNKTGRGKLSAFDKEEVIVTQSNELYEDIDYDKPREAQRVKDRVDLQKRTKRS
jgi:HPt (histidine-containing phosphotransfer) domain-containing protein